MITLMSLDISRHSPIAPSIIRSILPRVSVYSFICVLILRYPFWQSRIIVNLILLLLFNSWKKVTLILICFPFVICGIVAALLLTDSPFTFMAIIGMMGLIGMMVKNSIVLVDEIYQTAWLRATGRLHPSELDNTP